MAKLQWEKRAAYDKIDHYEWAKRRNKIQDKKWKLFTLENPKKAQKASKEDSINIDLGTHEDHDWRIVLEPTGPHAGKIVCDTCGGKHVTWLSKEHVRLIRQK
mgnify:CR=1 FL=1